LNAHIVNCEVNDFFDTFLPNGYLGTNILIKSTETRSLATFSGLNHSTFADMKTIRQGDIIFVHATDPNRTNHSGSQKIFGVFKAESEFCEEPTTPLQFQSKHIHFEEDSNFAGTGWRNITALPSIAYNRKISISHYIENNSNLCFQEGFHSTECFELKYKKKLWSVPERWQYTDTHRVIRPLMINEAIEIIKVLERENSDVSTRRTVVPANLGGFLPIEFNLNPNVVTSEKIIEGWILDNIGRHTTLDDAIGSFTCFGNNMPTSYMKFMDIFGYLELPSGIKKYKVIEVKKNDCVFPNDINQLQRYFDG